MTSFVIIMSLSDCRSSHKVFEDDYGRSERHIKTKPVKKKNKSVSSGKTKKPKGMEGKIVEEAYTWIGTPYRYGDWEKGKGSDCSGMVTKVYEKATGIKLPRNSKKQAEFCWKLNSRDVRPGDLVFFATGKNPDVISHVGIMIDDTRFIHASTKQGVVISEVTTPYYRRTFKMYGRVPR